MAERRIEAGPPDVFPVPGAEGEDGGKNGVGMNELEACKTDSPRGTTL